MVKTPSAQLNALYIFYHMLMHLFVLGVGLRQLCDWAVVLHRAHGTLDTNALQKQLTDYGLMKLWQAMGYILVHRMGLPEEELPFYNTSAAALSGKLEDIVIDEGNFGHSKQGKRSGNYAVGKLQSFMRQSQRSLHLFSLIPAPMSKVYGFYLKRGINQIFKDLSKK